MKKKPKPVRNFVIETASGQKRVVRSSVAPKFAVEVEWLERPQRVVRVTNFGGMRARVWEDDPTAELIPRTKVVVFERRKEALAFRDNEQRIVIDVRYSGSGQSGPGVADGPNGKLSERKVSKLLSVIEVENREADRLVSQYGGYLRTLKARS